MRRVFLDTETTGISWRSGDRLIEIGAIEFDDRKPSGRVFHTYLLPDCDIDDSAWQVHGITDEFLRDKPDFADVAVDFLDFIDGAQVLIHNASFDIGFLDAQLHEAGMPGVEQVASEVVDTLKLAKDMGVGGRTTLDGLLQKFKINSVERKEHGALKDALLLSRVWLAMTRGQESLVGRTLSPVVGSQEGGAAAQDLGWPHVSDLSLTAGSKEAAPVRRTLRIELTLSELQAHEDYMTRLVKR